MDNQKEDITAGNLKTQTVYTEVEKVTEWKVQRKINNVLIVPQWSFVEKKENQIVMSESDFIKAIGDAFEAGENRIICEVSPHNALNGFPPTKEQFLNNLIKQQP